MATPDRFSLPQVPDSTRKPEWLKVRLPHGEGYEAVKQLYEFLTKGTPPTVIDTGIVEVNRQNVDEWLQKIKDGEPVG